MNTTTLKPKELTYKRRAVAPVIATLLMVAIAVVGGTIIFVFSQGFFSSSQISGTPTIEAVKILGYDARPITALTAHDGNTMLANSAGDGDTNVEQGERVAVYVTNDSVQKITIAEMSFGGFAYDYEQLTSMGLYTGGLTLANYTVVRATPDTPTNAPQGEILAGQTATILIDLESDYKIGRATQFKLTTTNGAVFVGTVKIGEQSG